jgi:hypothetical protein
MLAARVLEDTGSPPLVCAYEDRFNLDGSEWLEFVVFTDEQGDPEALRTPFSTYAGVLEAIENGGKATRDIFAAGDWSDWDENAARALWESMRQEKLSGEYR